MSTEGSCQRDLHRASHRGVQHKRCSLQHKRCSLQHTRATCWDGGACFVQAESFCCRGSAESHRSRRRVFEHNRTRSRHGNYGARQLTITGGRAPHELDDAVGSRGDTRPDLGALLRHWPGNGRPCTTAALSHNRGPCCHTTEGHAVTEHLRTSVPLVMGS